MEFEFKRMDFTDVLSITYYGMEILNEIKNIHRNDRNLINVNMKNNELSRLIKEISDFSVDEQIEKKVDDSTPITIGMLEKVLNSKLVNNRFTPSFIKNKIIKPVEEMKEENEEPVNSIDLYNTIMNDIDNIGIELENNYNDAQATIETLNISKGEILKLIEKLNIVINAGVEDIEKYQSSEIEDPLKMQKIEFATKKIVSLRKTKSTLEINIQEKDLKIIALSNQIDGVIDWMVQTYPTLSTQVANSIETKYISNRTNELFELNQASRSIIINGAEKLTETTQKNIEMLKSGSLDTATINKYLKTVQEALIPVKGYIENKENTTKKLISELDAIDKAIDDNNNTILALIQSENITPSIEEPKTLKLEMKNSNNE